MSDFPQPVADLEERVFAFSGAECIGATRGADPGDMMDGLKSSAAKETIVNRKFTPPAPKFTPAGWA